MNKPRILILEDETITSHHLRRVLDRLGYEVVGVAADGISALEQLAESRPDLLLADIGLPGTIDGVGVAERAREDYKIPTVFLTAYSDSETIRRARVSEAYGFIVKPFDEQELQATIEIGLQHNALYAARVEELTAKTNVLMRTEQELNRLSDRLLRVQEREREEIARDLHDDFGQKLALLHVSIEGMRRARPPQTAQDYSEMLESLKRQVVDLGKDLRSVSHRLYPSILKDLGLAAAVRSQGEVFEEQHSIPVRVSIRDLPEDIDATTALSLYRITQEALHNILKHAGNEVTVIVAVVGGPESTELTICDTGKGFHAEDLKSAGGIGVASMAQRAEALGGHFSISSFPGRGTRIHVSIPRTPAALLVQ